VARIVQGSNGRNLDLNSLDITSDGRRSLVRLDEPVPRVDFETWVEGIAKQHAESVTSNFSFIQKEPGRVTAGRQVRDEMAHLSVRYELTVETLPEPGTYRVTFGAPHGDLLKPLPADWTALTPAQYLVPQIVRDGDTIPFEIYHGATPRKLVEYIHFGQRKPLFRTESAREIYSELAEFNVAHAKLRMNGAVAELSSSESLRGSIFWLYVPGQGRYDLAFKPRRGFIAAGEAAGNSLVFAVEGNVIRLDGSERIAEAGSAAYVVYARRDPAWQPGDEKSLPQAGISVEQ
jgi:hypothetical protein